MIKNALTEILFGLQTMPIVDVASIISDALDYVMDGGEHPDWYTSSVDSKKKALYELIVVRLDKPVAQQEVKLQECYVIRIALPANFDKFLNLIKTIRKHLNNTLKEAKDLADTAMARRPGWYTIGTVADKNHFKAICSELVELGIEVAEGT